MMKNPSEHAICHPSLQILNDNGSSASGEQANSIMFSMQSQSAEQKIDIKQVCAIAKPISKEMATTDEDEQQQFAGTSSLDDAEFSKAGRIRKRRYTSSRIQPTRVKKVMQSDEDIGRMVASVPVAIGSAMELFAEKLLLGAAKSVQQSSAKTLSPMHIKMAVSNIPHFSFLEPMLRDIHPSQQKSLSSTTTHPHNPPHPPMENEP